MSASSDYERHREILKNSLDKPHVARIYDYYLQGESPNNWVIDRDFAERMLQILPEARTFAVANRGFLRRAVRYLRAQGIRQFVDIGSGLPSAGAVHEIADEIGTDSHVVYVDNDPVALAHGQILLADTADPDRHHALGGNFFDTETLWQRIIDSGYIDPHEPVALLLVALLHFMPPTSVPTPTEALAFYRSILPRGSALVLTHATDEGTTDRLKEVAAQYVRVATSPVHLRPHAEVKDLFGDFELVDPGVVWTPQWKPELAGENEQPYSGDPAATLAVCGVGIKR
ncbi:SAM-dependent methyltransferase [Amycolatopsis cynarae]|uniref:SAM-dependent methyltransferase n=1 Tax=Amycolatopsis cynarae TaxID=2995223 RepID=A0ABY7B892_9PSEU|nr:SAM-dependent methyltransferase [Amycolatopsis sp. HUAS 11-8]WAL68565.1 SAM-dependent methyltransferase [Amycolatopsis sp. HUAS 11-8]